MNQTLATPPRRRISPAFRLSLLGNAALLLAAVVLAVRDRGRANATPHPAAATAADRVRPAPSAGAASRAPLAAAGGAEVTREGIARLEAAGIPRSVLADVVRQDFRRRWNKRVVELENRYAPKQPPQREYIALERRQHDEEIRALKAALGEDGYRAWDKAETLRKLNFEDVPMDAREAEQAYQLQKQLEDKQRELQLAMEDGDADIADMGTLQMQAQDAFEKSLQDLLGQRRYEQLKGYTIPVVEGHLEFNELSPTSEQVAALKGAVATYNAGQEALAKQLSEKSADPATIAAELRALNDARDASFRKAVGADAYENLRREHDPTYQTLTQYAGAWGLSDADVEPVYAQIKSFVDNVDSLRQAAQMSELAGQTADWNAINAAIEKSREQTEASLQTLIGNERLRRVMKNGLLSSLGSDRNAPHAPGGDSG